MYLLDTNVISEVRRKSPEALRWIEKTRADVHFICAVSLTEISKGAHMLSRRDDARASMIFGWLETVRLQFQDRILAIDESIAIECGRVSAIRTRGDMDCLIAAAAIVSGLILVTRNERDFSDTGVRLVNPWADA